MMLSLIILLFIRDRYHPSHSLLIVTAVSITHLDQTYRLADLLSFSHSLAYLLFNFLLIYELL